MTVDAERDAGLLVDVKRITKRYRRRQALYRVDLTVAPGEVVGLIGPNGAGKTTLIRVLTGMSMPSEGAGTVLGVPVGDRRRDVPFIGMMPERPAFIETVSGRRNLSLLFGIRGKPDEDGIEKLLRRVGLDPRDPRPVRTYSQGMRQRLSLAQAIGERPPLVILDEPTNGLDPTGIVDMRSNVRELADGEGMGVLLASHLLTEVEAVCDRVVMLADGRVQRTYTFADASAGPSVIVDVMSGADMEVLLRVPGVTVRRAMGPRTAELDLTVSVPDAVRALVSAGVSIEGVRRSEGSLERLYLEAVGSK